MNPPFGHFLDFDVAVSRSVIALSCRYDSESIASAPSGTLPRKVFSGFLGTWLALKRPLFLFRFGTAMLGLLCHWVVSGRGEARAINKPHTDSKQLELRNRSAEALQRWCGAKGQQQQQQQQLQAASRGIGSLSKREVGGSSSIQRDSAVLKSCPLLALV